MSINSVYTDQQPDPQLISTTGDNNTLYGSGVDMQGYEGVIFLATVQKGEAFTFTLEAQEDSQSNYGTAQNLAGSAVAMPTTVGADGFAFLEIKNPQKRYVRPAVVCPDVAAAKAVAIIAIRYGKQYLPETNADGKLLNAPAEGTP